jgi:hypothetical protein
LASCKAADWNLSHVVRDRLIAGGAEPRPHDDLFNRLNNAGLVDHSMVRELQRIANPGAVHHQGRRWWGRFMDLNGAMAHAVDVANKTAIAKAAYDLEYRKTGATTCRPSTPSRWPGRHAELQPPQQGQDLDRQGHASVGSPDR